MSLGRSINSAHSDWLLLCPLAEPSPSVRLATNQTALISGANLPEASLALNGVFGAGRQAWGFLGVFRRNACCIQVSIEGLGGATAEAEFE
jgi:hypothetical protein